MRKESGEGYAGKSPFIHLSSIPSTVLYDRNRLTFLNKTYEHHIDQQCCVFLIKGVICNAGYKSYPIIYVAQ